MISVLAQIFVFAGALILIGTLVQVRRLIERLPSGTVQKSWYIMTALIALFFVGYLAYAGVFWNKHATVLDLIVPGIFFFGACFVWLAGFLSLQTTLDVMRMSLLERETVTDPLTDVFNRRYLDLRLREEVVRARRHYLPLSILLLDIDHFKLINDKHGHQAGDQVLVSLGKVVAESLRESDVLTRYGGEEFLIITPHTTLLATVEIAERLRNSVETHRFVVPHEPSGIHVTCSIGVASLGNGIESVEELVHAADKNLYRAKREGRNRVIAEAPVPRLAKAG